MAYINEEDIKKIRNEADIVDVLSDYLTLQQKGRNYVALCPFHNDHSPSLIVSKEKQIFNCFTCRTGGNVFTFLMKFENISFVEAVEKVAQKIGYNLKVKNTPHESSSKEIAIYDLATKYYVNNLNTEAGLKAKKYLKERGISEEIIKEFKIGLALPQKDDLLKFLTKKGYEVNILNELGLVYDNVTNSYDCFINRIMIPITNYKGEVIAFTGRIFNGEDSAKYINTKETKIYKKSNILFNYSNAKNYIKNSGTVIIVEGNMDAIMMSSNGFKNTIALMGVAISNDQIKEIAKLRAKVILMLDNDNAGLEATNDIGDKFLAHNIECAVVRLSGAKDPDEYLRKVGIVAMQENITHAKSYLDFKINYLKSNKDLQTIPDVVKYIREVLASLTHTDSLTKEMIVTKLSKSYNIDKDILKQYLQDTPKEEKKREVVKNIVHKSKYDIAASTVLYAMMCDSKFIRVYKEKLGYFKNKIERIIASEIVYYNNSNDGINIADFTSYIENNEEIKDKVMSIISLVKIDDISMEEFNNCLTVILQELRKDEIKDLKLQMQQEMDINKKMEILTRITELKKEV